MPEISKTYFKIADSNIAVLHTKCTRGIYSDRLFKMVSHGLDRFYSLDKLEWMKEFLNDGNQHIAADCLECLCAHGMPLEDVRDVIELRICDRIFSSKVIEIAEKKNNPDILLLFMNEEDGYINRVIIALKNTGNESYLTTLMMSENESLVKSVDRITRSI